MGKPLSLDLRRRIVACVEAGLSRRAAAAKFDVSPSFVVELMRRYRETGSLEPARQGRPPGGRLLADAPFGHWGTQTFVAGLRCDELIAPWGIDGAMNRAIFDIRSS